MPYLRRIPYETWVRRMVGMTDGDARQHYLDMLANLQGRA